MRFSTTIAEERGFSNGRSRNTESLSSKTVGKEGSHATPGRKGKADETTPETTLEESLPIAPCVLTTGHPLRTIGNYW